MTARVRAVLEPTLTRWRHWVRRVVLLGASRKEGIARREMYDIPPVEGVFVSFGVAKEFGCDAIVEDDNGGSCSLCCREC